MPAHRQSRNVGVMSTIITPREAAEPGGYVDLGDDDAEHLHGYAVLGQPFHDGHYLAFRHFPASSIGPGYHAVWLRNPEGRWTVFADAPPERSCARYIGAAVDETVTCSVGLVWTDPFAATITVPDRLEWEIELSESGATRMATRVAGIVPDRVWRSDGALGAMAAMLRPILRAGAIRLAGTTPNHQTFQFRPERVWGIARTRAVIDGLDVGSPGALAEPERLADVRMPQRGLFAADLRVRYPSTAAV